MKRFKAFTSFLAIALIILAWPTTAFARGRQAYGETVVKCVNWTNPVKDHAYSYITRNSDYPVDNDLTVSMEVQYQEGDSFFWESPIGDSGRNREEARVERWRYSIMCNKTSFVAKAAGCDDYSATITASPATKGAAPTQQDLVNYKGMN